MKRRVHIRREVRFQPQGVVGCLVGSLLLLAGLVVGGILLWPIIGLALGVALGIVVLGLLVLAYFRLKWALRRFLRRRSGGRDAYEAEITDVDDGRPPRPRKQITVRRPD